MCVVLLRISSWGNSSEKTRPIDRQSVCNGTFSCCRLESFSDFRKTTSSVRAGRRAEHRGAPPAPPHLRDVCRGKPIKIRGHAASAAPLHRAQRGSSLSSLLRLRDRLPPGVSFRRASFHQRGQRSVGPQCHLPDETHTSFTLEEPLKAIK